MSNNDISNVLIEKVSNMEKLSKVIISILRIILLVIVIMVIVLVSIIYFKDYFDVKPVEGMQSIECSIDGYKYSYEVWQNNETSYMIDRVVTNDKDINIDTTKYTNFEDILKDIEEDVISRGGSCN